MVSFEIGHLLNERKARVVPLPGLFRYGPGGAIPRPTPRPYFERDTSTIFKTSIAKVIISVGTPMIRLMSSSFEMFITPFRRY